MLIRELIIAFRDHNILVDSLIGLDRNLTVTTSMLRKNKIPEKLIQYFESMSLWSVKGIGPAAALDLWSKGVRIGNLEKHIGMLPSITQLMLKYKPLQNIPSRMVQLISAKFMPSDAQYELVGSFRRKQPTSNDVDILWYPSKDSFSTTKISELLRELAELHENRWIVISQGPTKISGIFCLNANKSVEIDLWICHSDNPVEKAAMLLFATGNKNFNIHIRHIAQLRGFKLNQYGLFNLKNQQTPLLLKTEREIFDKIGMKWKEPWERTK